MDKGVSAAKWSLEVVRADCMSRTVGLAHERKRHRLRGFDADSDNAAEQGFDRVRVSRGERITNAGHDHHQT